MRVRSKGFTLIEIITAIVLISIIMIPVALIMMEYVRSSAYADSFTTASNIARREMGIINNLSYSDPTLANGYDVTTQNYAGYNYDLKRTVSSVSGTTDNLRMVRVRVFPHGSTTGAVGDFATYVMNVQYGGGAGNGQAKYFVASNGVLSWTQLSSVSLRNTSTSGVITMTGVIMMPSVTKTLLTMKTNNANRFSGSVTLLADTETQVNFETNFPMSLNTTYSGSKGGIFTFQTGGTPQTYSMIVKFIFSDGSQSQPMTWNYTI